MDSCPLSFNTGLELFKVNEALIVDLFKDILYAKKKRKKGLKKLQNLKPLFNVHYFGRMQQNPY